jgi:hypothetical protein
MVLNWIRLAFTLLVADGDERTGACAGGAPDLLSFKPHIIPMKYYLYGSLNLLMHNTYIVCCGARFSFDYC